MEFLAVISWSGNKSLPSCSPHFPESDYFSEEHWENTTFAKFFRKKKYAPADHSAFPDFCRQNSSENRYRLFGKIQLFNRKELGIKLGLSAQHLLECCDSNLAIRSFEKWGKEAPSHFIGDYSFVIWDRVANQLFCVTDHLGIKPCYYYYNKDKGIVVADTVTAIRKLCPFIRQIDTSYIADYLTSRQPCRDSTIFSEIRILPAAHLLTIDKHSFRMVNYWDIKENKQFFPGSSIDYADELKKLLMECVGSRIAGKSSVGVLLSGGLDSSSVACLAAKYYGELGVDAKYLVNVSRTFSEAYNDITRDEKKYAQQVAEHYGMSINFCNREILSPLDFLKAFYNDTHCPQCGPFRANGIPLYEMASSLNIKYLLTGFGGDELISMTGENIYPLLTKQGHLLQSLFLFRQYQKNYDKKFMKFFRAMMISPLLPNNLLKIYRARKNSPLTQMEKLSFLRNPYHKKTIFSEKNRGREVSENIPLDMYPRIEHELFNNRIQSVLADFDYCSRKYDFEIYHPLLDKRIVEFCTTVPPIEFIKDGWERSLIRRSMKGIVPETVRWRKYKCYFNIPYVNYIINGISVFEKILSKKSSMAWEYFDSKQIKAYLDLLKYSPNDIAYPEYLCRTLGRVANIASFIQWNEEN